MKRVILYSKTTGAPSLAVTVAASSDSEAEGRARSMVPNMPHQDFSALVLDHADYEKLLEGLPQELQRFPGPAMSIVDGKVVFKPAAIAAATDKATRRSAAAADKAAAKADAKMTQLSTMTKQDFSDLTAAQKWDMVFAFMKAHLDVG